MTMLMLVLYDQILILMETVFLMLVIIVLMIQILDKKMLMAMKTIEVHEIYVKNFVEIILLKIMSNVMMEIRKMMIDVIVCVS